MASPYKGSFLFLLDISNLQLVRDALKSAKFTDADWFDLGLKLGLEYSDLKSIEKDKDSNSTRLRESLGVWLSSNSVCTWEMLASALEELDRAAAEHIRNKYGDPASQIFQSYSTRISKVVFNCISIQLLYTEGLIMEESQKKIEGCRGFLVADVIKEILSNVVEDHSKLIKLGNILKSKEGAPFADDMLKDCKDTFAPDLNSPELNPSVSGSVSVKGAACPPTSVITVDLLQAEFQSSFDTMSVNFGIFRFEVLQLIDKKISSLRTFKLFLQQCFPDLESQISNANSVQSAMNIALTKCNIINIAAVNSITLYYKIDKAKKLITDYEEKIKQFCSKIPLDSLLNKKLSTSSTLTCETIQFLLDWKPDEHSLNDIRLLLQKAFSDLGKRVIVRVICPSNSIIIICYAPYHLLDALILQAQENLQFLIEEFSLIELTIGHCILYDNRIVSKEHKNFQSCYEDDIELLDAEAHKLVLFYKDRKESIAVHENKLMSLKNRQNFEMRLKLLQDKFKSKSHEIERLKLNLRCTSEKKKLLDKMTSVQKMKDKWTSQLRSTHPSSLQLKKDQSTYTSPLPILFDQPTDDAVFLSLGLNFDYSLGIHLGLSKSDITAIKKDNDSDQDKVVALFWKWRERKGSGATYLSLLTVLIEIDNKEAAEKLCQYYKDKHQTSSSTESSPSKFETQSSLPSFPPKTKQPNYSRSISYPVDNQKKVMWCEKIPGNRAWKIFDRHHDQIVNILRSDAVLCDSVLKILADMFLIGIAERGFIQQLTSLDIKSKAIMRRVSTFISKARNPIRAFVKFSAIIEEFDYFKAIYEEIKFEASGVGIIIKTSVELAKAKRSSSLTSKEASADISDTDDAGYDESLLTPSVKKYSRHLKSSYKKEKPDQKWSLENVPSKLYINLAVVCKNEDYRDPFSNSTIHGTNDDIFSHKESLSLEELCRIEYGEAILIEGAPGIGKSMLAFEICSRWVKGEALKKYPLLLLLRLRDKFIQSCKSVRDLLGCFLGEQSWKDAAVQDIIDNSGEGLIIILEGFDELPEHLTKRGSVFFQFPNELPCASLVFTSRPSAKHYLKLGIEFERHVEVIGFTHENINEYIHKFCKGNSDHIGTFNQYLDESPKVRDCLYIPIILVIICSIFQQYVMNKEQVPLKGIITSTKLYEAMIKMLLYRHIKSQTQELVSVDLYNLPYLIQEQFTSLCHMAYDGLKNRATELLFYADEDFETLGMMQKEVQVYPGTGDVIAYSFLHLTIQEFLAAYHISQMPKAEIEDIFNRLRNVVKFSTMLCFLSGLTELQSITPRVDQNLFSLNLLRCLYESGNEALTRGLFSNKDKFYKVRRLLPRPSPQDMFILGKCMALSSCQWGLSCTLRGMTSEYVEKLQKGLISIESGLSCTIEDISFSLNPIGDEGMIELLQFPVHILKNLVSLRLISCHLQCHAATEFSKQLKKFSSLETLFFHNNLLKEGDQLCLIEAMIPLKCCYVTFSMLSPDECAVLLTKVSSITEVDIYQLGSSSIEKVIECLPNSLSLEILHIEQSHCTQENLSLLPTTLPSSTLIKLELVNCAIDSNSVRTVIDAVLMSHHLEALNLSHNYIDDKGGAHLCSMLKQLFGSSEEPAADPNSSCSLNKFKFLDIGHNSFTIQGVSSFIDELAHFKNDSTNFTLSLSLGWKDQVCQHVSFTKVQQHLKFESNEDD